MCDVFVVCYLCRYVQPSIDLPNLTLPKCDTRVQVASITKHIGQRHTQIDTFKQRLETAIEY